MNSRLCQHHGQSVLLDPGWSVKAHVINTSEQLGFPVNQVKISEIKCSRRVGEKKNIFSSVRESKHCTVRTHGLSSSNVFTEYRGEVGSCCRTSTWFLFRTRVRRISLFSSDCSARSTLSTSFPQSSFSLLSGIMLPAQVETTPESLTRHN